MVRRAPTAKGQPAAAAFGRLLPAGRRPSTHSWSRQPLGRLRGVEPGQSRGGARAQAQRTARRGGDRPRGCPGQITVERRRPGPPGRGAAPPPALADAADALERAEAVAGTTASTARIRGDLRYRERRWREAARCYADAECWGTGARGRSCSSHGATSAWTRWRRRGGCVPSGERNEADASALVVLGEVALRDGREDDAVHHFERAHERGTRRRVRLRQADRGPGPAAAPRIASARSRSCSGATTRATATCSECWPGCAPRRRRPAGGRDLGRPAQAPRRPLRPQDGGLRPAQGGRPGAGGRPVPRLPLEDPEDLILFRTFVHLQRSRGALETAFDPRGVGAPGRRAPGGGVRRAAQAGPVLAIGGGRSGAATGPSPKGRILVIRM